MNHKNNIIHNIVSGLVSPFGEMVKENKEKWDKIVEKNTLALKSMRENPSEPVTFNVIDLEIVNGKMREKKILHN